VILREYGFFRVFAAYACLIAHAMYSRPLYSSACLFEPREASSSQDG
jgi:hypothetical protein